MRRRSLAVDPIVEGNASGAIGLAPPRAVAALVAIVLVAALIVTSGAMDVPGSGIWTSGGDRKAADVGEAYAGLPLAFERNAGQVRSGVDFVARGPNYSLFLEAGNATMALAAGEPLEMELVGARERARPASRVRLPGVVNYLDGSDPSAWKTGIPTYRKVAYEGVYPGIDVIYYGRNGTLEYDFVLRPGADPDDIVLRFDGAESLSIGRSGDLLIGTAAGVVRQSKPLLYQDIDGRRNVVSGDFARRGGHEVGFSVGEYDASRPLVIDPTLTYGTYLGGSGFDITFGVAVDGLGRAYVAGHTRSLNFPTRGDVSCPVPSPQPSVPVSETTSYQCDDPGTSVPESESDAFVSVLNSAGTELVWSTYLGGNFFDQAWDVAVDRRGNAYVVGSTNSFDNPETAGVNEGFPVTPTGFDRTCGTDGVCNSLFGDDSLSDVFLSKLSADGSELLYSTYLGGSDFDQETQVSALPSEMDIAVRGNNAYIVGQTGSADFPTTRGAFDRHCGRKETPALCDDGNKDAFLAIFDTSRSRRDSLVLSTYLGGSGAEEGRGVGVDNAGNVYVSGTTWGYDKNPDVTDSPTINNLKTKNARFSRYRGGDADAFVMKLNPRKTGPKQLKYSTYLGGGGRDQAWGLAVKSGRSRRSRGRGKAFVVGFTDSGDNPETDVKDGPKPYFPTTPGAFERTYHGRQHDPEVDPGRFLNGDGFLTKLKPSGRALAYSGLIGGENTDVASDVALDRRGRAYVTGYMTCFLPQDPQEGPAAAPCNAEQFPVTEDALWDRMNGSWLSMGLHNIPTDAFSVVIARDGGDFVFSSFLPGNNFNRGFGVAVRDRDGSRNPIRPESYYVGRTNSSAFSPVLESPVQGFQPQHHGGGREGYVIKLTH